VIKIKLKAIVFDFDDTLTDNKALDFYSFKLLSSIFDIYELKWRELYNLRRKSMTAGEIIALLIMKSKKSISLEACMKTRKQFLGSKNSGSFVRIKPCLNSVLKKFKREGYLLFIATRAPSNYLYYVLNNHKLTRFFDGLYPDSSEDKTQVYRSILTKLDLNPNNCLVVSNTYQDLSPALKLGMQVVGIKGSYGVEQILHEKVTVVKDMSELHTYIESGKNGNK
jgi:beta-phosphoglucomutase-like phosphatase (HAD superfamily)